MMPLASQQLTQECISDVKGKKDIQYTLYIISSQIFLKQLITKDYICGFISTKNLEI